MIWRWRAVWMAQSESVGGGGRLSFSGRADRGALHADGRAQVREPELQAQRAAGRASAGRPGSGVADARHTHEQGECFIATNSPAASPN